MAAIFFPIYTLFNLGLMIWSVSLFKEQSQASISILILILVLFGMIYDNLIISIGRLIDEGALLELLSRLRFLLHNLFVPLLVVCTAKLISQSGISWASNPLFDYGTWLIAIGLILYGLICELQCQELILINFSGTLRYKSQNVGIPISTILTSLIVAIAGGIIWHEIQLPWMFIGTVVMIFGNGLATAAYRPLIGSAVDLLFILGLLVTEIKIN
jgi:hypothetical protein